MKRVLDFLNDLRANNNREWFAANKPRYEEAKAIFDLFAGELIALVGEFDPLTRGLTLKDCTYRIYRDTRFSHDKTPYKTHFGVYVCPGGKKSGNAGYYFHIEPSNHLLDAGIYMPAPEVLHSVRDEIFDNGAEVVKAMGKAGKVGFELDMSNSLTRTPKGFPTDSEWDNYLKLKDFHLSKFVDDDYLLAPDLARRVATDFRATTDFMALVQRAAEFAHEEER